jgi:O-antigen/teichoic acid export membrane protein
LGDCLFCESTNEVLKATVNGIRRLARFVQGNAVLSRFALLIRSQFALDFLALLSSRSAAQVLTLAVGLLLVRAMAGPVFGAYSLATTSVSLAGVIADFGFDIILTREIAADREFAAVLTRNASLLRLILALLTTIGLTTLALLTPNVGRPDLLLIGGLSLAPRGVMRTVTAALTGLGRVRQTAWIEGIAAVASSLATVALVVPGFAILGDRAAAALWGLFVGSLVGLLAALRLTRFDETASPNQAVSWGWLLYAALPFMIINLAGAAFQSLDIYVVKTFYWQASTPDAVALYAAPFRILNVLLLVPTAWGVVALPRYVGYVRRPEVAWRALRRDLGIGLFMGLGLSAGCTLLAQPLTLIVLGPGYAPAAPILAVVCWMALPVCVSAPYIALLTATGRQTRIAGSVIVAGLLALVVNVLLAGTSRSVVDNLLVVAAVKVASMVVLLIFYALSLPRSRD